MDTQHCEYAKYLYILHFKWVNLCYLNYISAKLLFFKKLTLKLENFTQNSRLTYFRKVLWSNVTSHMVLHGVPYLTDIEFHFSFFLNLPFKGQYKSLDCICFLAPPISGCVIFSPSFLICEMKKINSIEVNITWTKLWKTLNPGPGTW